MTEPLARRMMRVIDHIHDHPTADLSLDALAEVAALSRFHFHRLFRALYGETASQMVRRMRMHRAAVALRADGTSLNQIARSVGYPDRASFARAFRESHGLSPAAYRRQGGPLPLLAHPKEQEPGPMPDVTLTTHPPRQLAGLPHQGNYQLIGRAFEKLATLIAARGVATMPDGMFGVYYDDPSSVAEGDLRSHAAFEIPADTQIAPPLEKLALPGGPVAVLLHRGPYATLPESYDLLFRGWLPQSGREPADSPCYEHYLNSPATTPQDELLTEICLPLAR